MRARYIHFLLRWQDIAKRFSLDRAGIIFHTHILAHWKLNSDLQPFWNLFFTEVYAKDVLFM